MLDSSAVDKNIQFHRGGSASLQAGVVREWLRRNYYGNLSPCSLDVNPLELVFILVSEIPDNR